jgi:hypothetical protein
VTAPVKEADAAAVEENVADVGIAVNIRLSAGVPQLIELGVVFDVQLAGGHIRSRNRVAVLVEDLAHELGDHIAVL